MHHDVHPAEPRIGGGRRDGDHAAGERERAGNRSPQPVHISDERKQVRRQDGPHLIHVTGLGGLKSHRRLRQERRAEEVASSAIQRPDGVDEILAALIQLRTALQHGHGDVIEAVVVVITRAHHHLARPQGPRVRRRQHAALPAAQEIGAGQTRHSEVIQGATTGPVSVHIAQLHQRITIDLPTGHKARRRVIGRRGEVHRAGGKVLVRDDVNDVAGRVEDCEIASTITVEVADPREVARGSDDIILRDSRHGHREAVRERRARNRIHLVRRAYPAPDQQVILSVAIEIARNRRAQ